MVRVFGIWEGQEQEAVWSAADLQEEDQAVGVVVVEAVEESVWYASATQNCQYKQSIGSRLGIPKGNARGMRIGGF